MVRISRLSIFESTRSSINHDARGTGSSSSGDRRNRSFAATGQEWAGIDAQQATAQEAAARARKEATGGACEAAEARPPEAHASGRVLDREWYACCSSATLTPHTTVSDADECCALPLVPGQATAWSSRTCTSFALTRRSDGTGESCSRSSPPSSAPTRPTTTYVALPSRRIGGQTGHTIA